MRHCFEVIFAGGTTKLQSLRGHSQMEPTKVQTQTLKVGMEGCAPRPVVRLETKHDAIDLNVNLIEHVG